MTTASVNVLLGQAAHALESLARRYESVAREYADDPARAEFAAFLASREHATADELEQYPHDAPTSALDVHVRFGDAFPHSTDDLELPEHPSLDELIELARRTDTLLEQLSERIQVYAASYQLHEILQALEDLVGGRRRQLTAALHELERYQPSGATGVRRQQ